MKPALLYLIQSILVFITIYLSFKFGKRSWFIYPYSAASLSLSIIWSRIIKQAESNNQLFLYSLIWDIVIIFLWAGIPIILFDLKLTKLQMIGTVLVCFGLICFSLSSRIK